MHFSRMGSYGDDHEIPIIARGEGCYVFAELGAAVAGVNAEEAGEAIEVAVAVLVEDVAALAADDDRDLVLVAVGAHPREVHPEMSSGHS